MVWGEIFFFAGGDGGSCREQQQRQHRWEKQRPPRRTEEILAGGPSRLLMGPSTQQISPPLGSSFPSRVLCISNAPLGLFKIGLYHFET